MANVIHLFEIKLNEWCTYERWNRGAVEGAGTEFTEDEEPE